MTHSLQRPWCHYTRHLCYKKEWYMSELLSGTTHVYRISWIGLWIVPFQAKQMHDVWKEAWELCDVIFIFCPSGMWRSWPHNTQPEFEPITLDQNSMLHFNNSCWGFLTIGNKIWHWQKRLKYDNLKDDPSFHLSSEGTELCISAEVSVICNEFWHLSNH